MFAWFVAWICAVVGMLMLMRPPCGKASCQAAVSVRKYIFQNLCDFV
jgi:hypothetical protein